MNWFKRLCLFVFGLSGLLALAALCLTWVGPWTAEARTLLLETQWYFIALEVLVCIAAVGLLVCLGMALFVPRNPRETIVADVNGGSITVTRTAIVSQARHVVENDGTCVADSIRVRMRKRGHVRVSVRVTPRHPVDVVAYGEKLYAELGQGLAQVCGQSVQSVDVTFTDPQSLEGGYEPSAQEPAASHESHEYSYSEVSVPLAGQTSLAANESHDDAEVVVGEWEDPAFEQAPTVPLAVGEGDEQESGAQGPEWDGGFAPDASSAGEE